MTAPDHRPYLGPTDLRTPEDVVRWQRDAADRLWRQSYPTITDVLNATEQQIDRERRKACRRGALDEWAHVAELVRFARTQPEWAWAVVSLSLSRAIAKALAFRAAARQP